MFQKTLCRAMKAAGYRSYRQGRANVQIHTQLHLAAEGHKYFASDAET